MSIVIEYVSHIPEITLVLGGCVVLLMGAFASPQSQLSYGFAQATILIALFFCLKPLNGDLLHFFNGFYLIDNIAVLSKVAMCVFMIVVLFYSKSFIDEHQLPKGEYYSLAIFSLTGMLLIASSAHLLMIYLGLELLSLSLYAMVAMNRDDSLSSEAAIKYFILGAIASGFLLYGISLLYGLTGTLYLVGLVDYSTLTAANEMHAGIGMIVAIIFIVIGLAFKLGAVPFHMWLPDVYQGAPLPVTMLIASVPKIAGVLLAIRLLLDGVQFMHGYWQQALIALAVLSLVIGNVVAIAQSNLRRMLAYSTIGHVGYILMGLLVDDVSGYSASIFYTIIYALMSSAVFGILLCAARVNRPLENLADLQGLSKAYPWLAFLMLLLMFSMAGIPLTVGFYAKLNILQAVVGQGEIILAAIAVVSSVIGAFYYLRVVKLMYFDDNEDESVVARLPVPNTLVLSAHSLLVVALFISPQFLMTWCIQALG
ncbi:MAG: NADH-quinone oxidoreductase subunit NuoN [Pseudomonadota bacterium]